MTIPTTVDSEVYANTDYRLQITIKDSAGVAIDLSITNGSGGALAGSEINYVMQKSEYDSTDQIYKEMSDGIEFNTDGTDGVINIDLTHGSAENPLINAIEIISAGSANTLSRRSHRFRPSSMPLMPSRSSTNSSPPNRAAMSTSLRCALNLSAMHTRSASPTE